MWGQLSFVVNKGSCATDLGLLVFHFGLLVYKGNRFISNYIFHAVTNNLKF